MEREREGLTWMQAFLKERRLTTAKAAEICGISRATMEIVARGYPTLPCLALQIARGLGLTREEAKPLGKPLESKAWGKDGLPMPEPIDMDPLWYNSLPVRGKRSRSVTELYSSYVDTRAVLERLIELDRDVESLGRVLKSTSLRSVNDRERETRIRYIKALAHDLDVSPEEISAISKPERMRIIRFEMDVERLHQLMRRPGFRAHDLAAKMYRGKNGMSEFWRQLKRIESGEAITVEKAVRWADALGVELETLGSRVVKTY